MFEALQYLKSTPLYEQEKIRLKSLEQIKSEVGSPSWQEYEDGTHMSMSKTSQQISLSAEQFQTGHLAGSQSEEGKSQKAHKNEDGDMLVSDDEHCYLDETDPTDDVVPVQTCVVDDASAHELRQQVLQLAPCEGQHPLQLLLDEFGEELCYPKLFGGHKRVNANNSKLMIHRHELCNADRRFANQIDNLFMKFRMSNIRTVLSAASFSMRVGIQGSVTAGQMLNPVDTNYFCAHDLGFANLKQLRGSPDYKQNIKRELFAMIRQLGKPAFFLTLSAADTKWLEMVQILYAAAGKGELTREQAAAMSVKQRADLIANDPVTCARYYNRRVSRFIKGVIVETLVLGNITDYAGIDEFQARGTPHTHMLLWSDSTPRYREDSLEDVIRHVDLFITTDTSLLPDELKDLQRHRHSRRCGGHHRACCFGFPMPPMPSTQILEPLDIAGISGRDIIVLKENRGNIKNALRTANKAMTTARKMGTFSPEAAMSTADFINSIGLSFQEYLMAIRFGLKRPTLYMKRGLRDNMINAFNLNILANWQANMDIQPVLDEYSAAMYVASYISKSQRGMSNLLSKVQKEDFPNSAAMLKRLGAAFINASEICAQEAVYHILALPLRRFSRTIQFVNTNPQARRYRVALRNEDLEDLDSQETDIFYNSPIDRYSEREAADTTLCLADYVALFKWERTPQRERRAEADDCSGSDDDDALVKRDSLWLRARRNLPKVLRFVGCDRRKDLEAYCREQVLLFSAWDGSYEEPFNNCSSWADCFACRHAEIKSNSKRYCQVDEQAWETAIQDAINSAANATNLETTEEECDPMWDRTMLDEGSNTQNTVVGRLLTCQNKARFTSPEYFGDSVSKLNAKQHQFFQHVMYNITRSVSDKPLRLFLTGGAGVGKSAVIDTITQAVTQHFNYDENAQINTLRVLLMAPTGKAAFHISAHTLHSALNIPPNQKGKQMCGLGGEKLADLQHKFALLKLVIIDEVSMLGRNMYKMVDRRLRQILCRDELFGGLHIIFVGDFFQLAPVLDNKLFVDEPGHLNTWAHEFSMFELTDIMRQKDDQAFAMALNRLREGLQTESDIGMFKARITPVDKSLTYMFAFNDPKDAYNADVMHGTEGFSFEFQAIDVLSSEYRTEEAVRKAKAQISAMPLKATQKLLETLHVKEALPVELTTNIDVSDGLCNGSSGHVCALTGQGHNTIMWVRFEEDAMGRALRSRPAVRALQSSHHLPMSLTPIYLVTKDIYKVHGGLFFRRTQFPLVLACGVTVHHCQGGTFTKVGVDMVKVVSGKKRKIGDGMIYTAYSRATTLEGLHLASFDEADINIDKQVVQEMKRLRTSKCLVQNCPAMKVYNDRLCLYNHNVRSFRKHGHNITTSPDFAAAHVCFFQETRCTFSEHQAVLSLADRHIIEIPHEPGGSHGIAFVCRTDCNMTELHRDVRADGHELLCVQVMLELTKYILIGLYNPPGGNLQYLFTCLQTIASRYVGLNTVVVGDFNINAGSTETSDMKQLQAIMATHDLQLAESADTRVCGEVSSRIDHVWSFAGCETAVNIGYTCLSDHMPMHVYVKPMHQEQTARPNIANHCNKRASQAADQALPGHTLLKKHKMAHVRLLQVPGLSSLQPGAWLDDEVINATILLLRERNTRLHADTTAKGSYFFDSFFFVMLAGPSRTGYEYDLVRAWTSHRSLQRQGIHLPTILQFDRIVLPIHLGNHWTCAVVDITQQAFHYYDSFMGECPSVMTALQAYVRDEYMDKLECSVDTASWPIRYEKDIPRQTSSCDCGVFALFFAKYVADGVLLDFAQSDMSEFRMLLSRWITDRCIP